MNKQLIFSQVKNQIISAMTHHSHILVYTFNGSGCSYILESIAANNHELSYINKPTSKLTDQYHLVDLDLASTLELYSNLGSRQKCLFVIQNGTDFNSSRVEILKAHSYVQLPIGCRPHNDISILAREVDPKLTNNDCQRIFSESHGIARLAKHMAINLSENQNILTNIDLTVRDIISSIQGYTDGQLQKLGLIEFFNSQISKTPSLSFHPNIDIKINFNLTFTEAGKLSPNQLSPIEAKIIQRFLISNLQLSKEDISEVKYGVNQYDQFSDQAINKTMRRLDSKLTIYQIRTIPKTGYVLCQRS